MKQMIIFFACSFCSPCFSGAQKIESIHFNLYTDSLKKGFYNYINVDGLSSDGTWLPLDSTQLYFTAHTGMFEGNDLFIDSSYTGDSVVVKVTLKSKPELYKQVVIYIRKRGFNEPLPTNEELLNKLRTEPRRKKKSNLMQP